MRDILRSRALTADALTVEPRFVRSADIVRDHPNHDWLPPYRFSTKSIEVLRAVLDESTGGSRAIALVGPYGSGKSLLTVALMSLLDHRVGDDWTRQLEVDLGGRDAGLLERCVAVRSNGGYLSVALEASPEGLAHPLLLALRDSLGGLIEADRRLARRIDSLLRVERVAEVVQVVEDAARVAVASGLRGLLLAVDEFGRVLEGQPKAAVNSLALIQELAELSDRMREGQLKLLVSVHQGFQDYASTMSPGRQKEWAKVQGRFLQISYQADISELYAAFASSIRTIDTLRADVERWVGARWPEAEAALGLDGQDGLEQYVAELWPLDPVTAFLLPRLAVAIGQNERSAFAFLSSGDPRAMRSWIQRNLGGGTLERWPSLEADYLFDFFSAIEFGAVLPRRTRQVLAQARIALEQLSDGTGIDTRILKAIAVISLVREQARLRPTFGAIAACVASVSRSDVTAALERLTRHKVVVYHRHSEEFALNPGSGVDVDLLVDEALREGSNPVALRSEVEQLFQLEPVIAHRVTFVKGTTRSFSQSFVLPDQLDDGDHMQRTWSREGRTRPDGRIRYVLAVDDEQLAFVRRAAPTLSNDLEVLVVPDEPLTALPSVAMEVAALRRLRDSPDTPLDRVARQEMTERVQEATAALEQALSSVLNPGSAIWYAGSPGVHPSSRREVQALLSAAAETAFHASPVLRNELINRRDLSSAAVVAAKLIVERLIGGDWQEGLGFTGNGPEVSITRALLVDTGMLRKTDGDAGWTIGAPEEGAWASIWNLIDQRIRTQSHSGVTVSEIWDALAERPYGIRAGVLPLFTWIFLAANRDSLCLFESGTYIPVWSVELYDRMSRWPEKLTVRHLATDAGGSSIVSGLLTGLPSSSISISGPEYDVPLNRFLRALFAWYRGLPEFSKKTRDLSIPTQALRGTLNRAKDPVELVLRGIPEALGLAANVDGSEESRASVLVASFSAACEELSRAYPQLLGQLVREQARLLGVHTSTADVRQEYRRLRKALGGFSLGPASTSFLLRAADDDLPDDEWCVSIASVVVGTPPSLWSDSDGSTFVGKLAPLLQEVMDGVATRVRLGEADGALSDASRLAIFRQGQAVLDVVNHRPLSEPAKRALAGLKPILDAQLSHFSSTERQAVITRLVELFLGDQASKGDSN